MSELLKHPTAFRDVAPQFATSGVYVLYCTKTDTYYIGQATVVLRRLFDHFDQLHRGKHQNQTLQEDYDECGEDGFVVDLLADMPNATQHTLTLQETKEIQRFKTYGKLLYNKVGLTVRVSPPEPRAGGTPSPYEPPSNPRANGANSSRRPSHAELLGDQEVTSGTCYDCGLTGYLAADVFVCDDGHARCQSCIESYLDGWRITLGQSKQSLGRHSRGALAYYRRWLVPHNSSLQEHILRAVANFAQRHGYTPTKVYIHPSMNPPATYRGIEVAGGGIVPPNYIDILIERQK